MPALTDLPRPPRIRRFRRAIFAGLLLLALFVLMPAALYLFNNRAFTLNIPTPTLPADNAYDDFVRAGKMAQGMKHRTPSNMPAPPKKTHTFVNYKAAALDFAPAQTVIHNALGKPCQHPPVRSISISIYDNNALFRNLARNISGAGRYEQLDGHPLQAANILLDGVEMSTMTARGGGLVDSIVSDACQFICLVHFEELLPHLTAQELRHVADRMAQIQAKKVSCGDILLEEGYTSIAGMQEALRQSNAKQQDTPLQMARGLIQSDSDKLPTREEAAQIAQYVFSSKERMLAQMLDYYRAIAQEAQQPYAGKSHVAAPANVLAHLLLPDVDLFREKFLHYDAIFTVLRMEVALCQYHAEHGRFPQAMDTLVPAYLSVLPDDPFGGAKNKPLRYKVTPDGKSYVLYSIGPNMADDNGKPEILPSAGSAYDLVSGHLFPKSY